MLVLLAPSETKAMGGDPEPLDFETLSFGQLTKNRKRIAKSLAGLSAHTNKAQKLLKITSNQIDLLALNRDLHTAPTMNALSRYTGVAYDALDAHGSRTGQPLSPDQQEKIAIISALFGVVKATDKIPYYRLSAGSKLEINRKPRTLKSLWGSDITDALNEWQKDAPSADNAIFDLRSGSYQSLGSVEHAVDLRVESLYPTGERKVVSHFNKHYKGLVARELVRSEKHFDRDNAQEQLVDLISSTPHFIEEGFHAEKSCPSTVLLTVPTPVQ